MGKKTYKVRYKEHDQDVFAQKSDYGIRIVKSINRDTLRKTPMAEAAA
jgi:hypothetical protein